MAREGGDNGNHIRSGSKYGVSSVCNMAHNAPHPALAGSAHSRITMLANVVPNAPKPPMRRAIARISSDAAAAMYALLRLSAHAQRVAVISWRGNISACGKLLYRITTPERIALARGSLNAARHSISPQP